MMLRNFKIASGLIMGLFVTMCTPVNADSVAYVTNENRINYQSFSDFDDVSGLINTDIGEYVSARVLASYSVGILDIGAMGTYAMTYKRQGAIVGVSHKGVGLVYELSHKSAMGYWNVSAYGVHSSGFIESNFKNARCDLMYQTPYKVLVGGEAQRSSAGNLTYGLKVAMKL